MTTDSNGTFKGTQDHLAFGEEGGTSGTSEKHRFTSYERDNESASDYAVNRQHQTSTGRFMQPDIAGPDVGVPQSWNRYGYVFNDPMNLKDQEGLFPILTGLINFFASLTFSYSVSVYASPDAWIIPVATNIGQISPKVAAVVQGVAEARGAFAKRGCRSLFGNADPNTLLNTYVSNNLIRTSSTYPENGNPSHQIPFDSTGIGARTSYATGSIPVPTNPNIRQSANTITLNETGFFFTNFAVFAGRGPYPVNFVPSSGMYGLTIGQLRGAVIIHELLHVITQIPSDGLNPAQSFLNSERVRLNCFKDIASALQYIRFH